MSCKPVHAVILASGFSRRLPGYNKLLLPCPGGKTLVEQAMNAVANIAADAKILVYSDEKVASIARANGFSAVYNAESAEGKAAGIRLAAKTAPEGDLLFTAADQYGADAALLEKISKTAHEGGADAVFTRTESGYGLPAFFSGKLRPFLMQISGEQGGKDALALFEKTGYTPKTAFADTSNRQFADIDTWSDYLAFLENTGISHLFITGERGAGKSTLLRAIVQAAQKEQGIQPADGLLIYVNRTESKTENRLYIERISSKEKCFAARLRKSDKTLLEFNSAAFDDFACAQLELAAKNPAALITIDELGRLEEDCAVFHRTVRTLLDRQKVRVLAALQDGASTFNEELKARKDAIVLPAPDKTDEVSRQNR